MVDDGTDEPTRRTPPPEPLPPLPPPAPSAVLPPWPPAAPANGRAEERGEERADDPDGIVVTSYEGAPLRSEVIGSPPPVPDTDPGELAAPGRDRPGAATVTPAPAPAPPDAPRRRRRRQTLTFLGALGLVVVVGLGALAVFTGTWSWPFGGTPHAAATPCASAESPLQAVGITQVRVYNASNRRGLALATARELQKRGFRVPEPPRNDPHESKPTTAAVIRHGPGGLAAARTVATQIKGTVGLEQDDRLGEVVDLVLGQTFALVDPAAGTAALKARPAASASCRATG